MNPRFTITDGMIQGLAHVERARGFLEAAQLSPKWVRQMSKRALLLEAHHTTHIEGTRLTLSQAEQLLAGYPVLQADPEDARELLNYRDAFNLVSDYLDSGAPITESLIREIHKRLVAGVRGERAQPGKYRLVQNYVVNSLTGTVIYTPPPPGDVPALMRDLVAWLNNPGQMHPVLASGIAQFQLVHIHPFIDGNGRTSRLLSTLYLYRAGYDFKRLFTISEYYDRDRDAFYAALQSVREANLDLTQWLEYFVAGLVTQLTEVKERGRQAIKLDLIARERQLNRRQVEALRYLLARETMNVQEFEQICPTVTRRTLQRDLKDLLAQQLIVEVGGASTDPNRRYRLGVLL
ncbi:MAG: Fic family protein [Anaerolineales bacterium]|nr:Fic family protein [Anaerolineales bacterium]MCB8951339.1 Fic family protein [Ardenticatenales bacterium]